MSTEDRLTALSPMLKGAVDEVDSLSAHAFAKRYAGKRPVVVRRACRAWPASKWKLSELAASIAPTITVRQCDDDGVFADSGTGWSSVEADSTDFFNMLQSDQPAAAYLTAPIGKLLPSHVSDTRSLVFLSASAASDSDMLWIGKDTYNQVHYHPGGEAVANQLIGEKLFLLFAPESVRHLYYNPWHSPHFNKSSVPFARPGRHTIEEHPGLRKASAWECVLRPGDTLYIPNHWPHAVYCRDVAVLWTMFWPAKLREWPPFPGRRTLMNIIGAKLVHALGFTRFA